MSDRQSTASRAEPEPGRPLSRKERVGLFLHRAEPTARVEVMGRTIAVRADELPADEAADWWRRILRRDPSYERYARATRRTIPIVRLVPGLEAD
jgi:hypothetical protein